MKNFLSPLSVIAMACQLLAFSFLHAQTGTWTQLATPSPHPNNGVCLLMTDGTVLCKNTSGPDNGTGWDRLTPDIHGSYVNGTWDTIASMINDRLYFSSQVLPTGKVYVAGGEYGSGGNAGEVYDPVANTWTLCGPLPNSSYDFVDANSELLYDGDVLEGLQEGPTGASEDNLFWSPTTLDYTLAPNSLYGHDEAAWLKLRDSSILFVGIGTDNSNRYIPQTNTWVNDGVVPGNIYDPLGEESGSAFLLPPPDGRAIFFGATPYNAFYTPTNNTNPGTWASADSFPIIQGTYVSQDDAPGAMMVNGHILLAVSPEPTTSSEFINPIYFVEYDYTTNTFTQVKSIIPYTGGDSIPGQTSYQAGMLDLPDGSVLVSVDQSSSYSNSYMIYTPGSGPIPQGKPTINSILPDGCPSYIITGKLFNGISEGSAYGDDWQNATNYPIVRLSNGTNVYYAKTTDWNRLGAVQTDSLEDSAVFTLPVIPGGTYSLVVIANGFASDPTLFTVFGISSISQTNASCGSGGTATVNLIGGLSPYTYSWSDANSQTTSTATGLTAGTYTVTASDNNACTATASFTITQSTGTAVIVTSTVTRNATCTAGGSDSASVSGGTSPYTYQWSDAGSQTTAVATGLSAGTYTVTVTDSGGCSGTASGIIVFNTNLAVTTTILSNAVCLRGGSDSASASGGISPYTYQWNDGNSQTTAVATNLSAGSYTITVTDSAGCSATASAAIIQSVTISLITTVISNVSCNGGSNGIDSVSVIGGVSPYTYLWNDANSQTTAIASGLSAGNYVVLVSDSNGCSATVNSTISQPDALTASAAATGAICSGNTGVATVTASGGTMPYTYLWNDGNSQTTASATGLSAGTYTVTVQDSCGAIVTSTVTLTQPAPLSVAAISGGSVCSGNSGFATASVSGGTLPYTYQWSDAGSQTTAVVSGLSTGTYTVTVNDSCGNSGTASVVIIQVSPLTVSTSVTSSSCSANNGTATALVNGGTSPYTYSWNTGSTDAAISGLGGGTYVVTVSDSCGNTAVDTAVIVQSSVTISIASRTILACDQYGYIVAHSAAGGVPPYTYLWAPSGGTTIFTTSNLSAGTYTITATDANGCSGTASEVITLPAVLSLTASVTSTIVCFEGTNGGAMANPAGGTLPYTYSWFPGNGTSATEGNLSAGTYVVTVTDSNGCYTTASVTLGQPAGMTITHDSGSQDINGNCDGMASVTVAGGGTPPYTYLWATGGQTTDTIKGQCSGNYCCTITDNNGCSQVTCVTITNSTGVENVSGVGAELSIYPNPNNGEFTIESSVVNGQRSVEIYDVLGQEISAIKLTGKTNVVNLSENASGIYFYRALREDGSLVKEGKLIIQK